MYDTLAHRVAGNQAERRLGLDLGLHENIKADDAGRAVGALECAVGIDQPCRYALVRGRVRVRILGLESRLGSGFSQG